MSKFDLYSKRPHNYRVNHDQEVGLYICALLLVMVLLLVNGDY